jgi:hypothetical protein
MGQAGAEPGAADLTAPLTPMRGEAPLAGAEPGAEPLAGPEAAGRVPPAEGVRPPDSGSATVPPVASPASLLPSERGRRQPARYGLRLQFAQHPDDAELARLIESTVWINEAHPAYRRARASRSEGYHVAVAVALALAPLAVEPAKEHGFVTAFLSAWGAAGGRRKGRRG